MKRIFAAAAVFLLAAALVPALLPKIIESSAPVCAVFSPSVRNFCETVKGSGSFSYSDECDITCALPVVIERLLVEEGDSISVGDTVAVVDRKASAEFIENVGRKNLLGFSATDLQSAAALIPEKITANCSGRVISVCKSGSAVQSGTAIVTVSQGEEIGITAAVSELDIAKIELGQDVMFTPAAYLDEVFFGKVTGIASAAHSQYNGAVLETVVDMRITPNVPDKRFKSGLSADVSVILSDEKEIITLPYSAIEQDEQGEYVYVYENGMAVRRNILTGEEFSDSTEIRSGVSREDEIFADPKAVAGKKYIRVEGVKC